MREVSSTQVITAIAITTMRPYRAYTHVTVIAMHMHARNDHRNAHARTQRRGCAVVVGIDADFARYRVKTRVCV